METEKFVEFNISLGLIVKLPLEIDMLSSLYVAFVILKGMLVLLIKSVAF